MPDLAPQNSPRGIFRAPFQLADGSCVLYGVGARGTRLIEAHVPVDTPPNGPILGAMALLLDAIEGQSSRS